MARSKLMNLYISRMAKALGDEGERLCRDARDLKETGDETKNQRDAFGYIVYFDGKVIRKGYANPTPESTETHKGWAKYGIPDGTGRSWLDEFMNTFKPNTKNFALVIVNAAFYSLIQEDGANPPYNHDYQIISQVYQDLDDFGKKFKAHPRIEFPKR